MLNMSSKFHKGLRTTTFLNENAVDKLLKDSPEKMPVRATQRSTNEPLTNGFGETAMTTI